MDEAMMEVVEVDDERLDVPWLGVRWEGRRILFVRKSCPLPLVMEGIVSTDRDSLHPSGHVQPVSTTPVTAA